LTPEFSETRESYPNRGNRERCISRNFGLNLGLFLGRNFGRNVGRNVGRIFGRKLSHIISTTLHERSIGHHWS
jgi:hypothetical protein